MKLKKSAETEVFSYFFLTLLQGLDSRAHEFCKENVSIDIGFRSKKPTFLTIISSCANLSEGNFDDRTKTFLSFRNASLALSCLHLQHFVY